MARTLTFSIEDGDITKFSADVIALKHAQAFHGADRAVARKLEEAGISRKSLAVGIDEFQLVLGRGAIAARYALFVGVPRSSAFGYPAVKRFAERVLEVLAIEAPEIKHLAMTTHGTGFGLDLNQSFLSQCRGLIESGRMGHLPEALERITIVERKRYVVDACIKYLRSPEMADFAPYLIGSPSRGTLQNAITALTLAIKNPGSRTGNRPSRSLKLLDWLQAFIRDHEIEHTLYGPDGFLRNR